MWADKRETDRQTSKDKRLEGRKFVTDCRERERERERERK
jgi:hypothetical protein